LPKGFLGFPVSSGAGATVSASPLDIADPVQPKRMCCKGKLFKRVAIGRKPLRFYFGVKTTFHDVSSDDNPMSFHYFLAKMHFLLDGERSFSKRFFFAKTAGISLFGRLIHVAARRILSAYYWPTFSVA